MAIFTHTDSDGDSLEVLAQASNILWFRVDQDGERLSGAYVDRDAALRLHAALSEWLYPVHTPEYANRSLIEQMIERAVKDQVAAVLPLHLKTVAEHRPQECPGVGQCPEADPEPHDVGHPTYEDARPHPAVPECGKCGAPWSDTHGQPGDPCAPAPSAPAPAGPTWDDELWGAVDEGLVRPLPIPVCPECAHSWTRHMPFSLNLTEDECSVRGCECTRVRP